MIPFYLSAQTIKIPQIPLEAYGKLPSKSMVVISPNAERIAYRDTSNNRDVMIVLNLLDNSLIAAIDIEKIKPKKVYFVDNEKLIFVVSEDKYVPYQGKLDFSVAFAYNLTSQKMHQLLKAGDDVTKQLQLGLIRGISPDRKYAYIQAYLENMSSSLLRVDIEKKRKYRMHRKGTSDTDDFFLGEDGEVVARERYDNINNSHIIEARVNDEWKEIFREKARIKRRSFHGLTPDRKSLVMRAWNRKTGHLSYYTMSLTDGEISAPLFSHNDKSVGYVIKDINRVVHGVKYSGFIPTYEFFDEKLNARMRGLNKALPGSNFRISSFTPDWSSMILQQSSDQSSGSYLLYQNGSLKKLLSARPDIPPAAVNPVTEYSFKARDGLTIPSLITTPVGKNVKNLPAIMMPHGGPRSHDKKTFHWRAQYFANQGYVVIQPQFRGSDGFGVKHLKEGYGEWGRKMQDDLTDAVNDLANKGTIDKNRVCIVGGSYGGYAALAGAVFTPDLYKCVVSINGVSDVELMLSNAEYYAGRDHWVVSYWNKIIRKGNFGDDFLAQISPINHVKNITAPVLLIHGERDNVVPFEQSDNMFDALEGADKDVTLIELKDGDHYLSNATNRVKALKAIDDFIKKFI